MKFTIHFLHCFRKVSWFLEAYKSVALAFVCPFVSDDFSSLKGWKFIECSSQQFIGNVIAEVPTKYSRNDKDKESNQWQPIFPSLTETIRT